MPVKKSKKAVAKKPAAKPAKPVAKKAAKTASETPKKSVASRAHLAWNSSLRID